MGWSSAWLLVPPGIVFLAGWALTLQPTGQTIAEAAQSADDAVVRFTDTGHLVRPDGYREWIYTGTPLTPNDLNPPEAPFPEFHSVYIDPVSYRYYVETGTFREGTVLIKELASVGSTRAVSGKGYFMGDFIGLEATVKSAARFPDEPGNWAYFSFGHEYPLADTAEPFATGACNACHASSAADDHIFTQYYPVLRAAKSGQSTALGGGAPMTRESALYEDLTETMTNRTDDAVRPSAETPAATSLVPADPDRLFDYLTSGAYRRFEARESGTHASQGPHSKFGLPVRVFLGPTLEASLRAGSGAHPPGASVVKEMYDADGELEGWAVMVKTGSDSHGGNGWFWYETTDMEDRTNVVAAGNGVPLCSGCHASGNDFVLTAHPLK